MGWGPWWKERVEGWVGGKHKKFEDLGTKFSSLKKIIVQDNLLPLISNIKLC